MLQLLETKQHAGTDQIQYSQLVKLAKTDWSRFELMSDFLPLAVTITRHPGRSPLFVNQMLEKWLELDRELIMALGFEVIRKRLDHTALHWYEEAQDRLDHSRPMVNYIIRLEAYREMQWLTGQSVVLNGQLRLHFWQLLKANGPSGVAMNELLNEVFAKSNGWDKYNRLSSRERQILQLVAKGNTSRTLSELLNISEHTVKTHRKNLCEKLDLCNMAELTRFAMAFQLVGCKSSI